MKAAVKNWLWFVALMVLILGMGFYLGNQRRNELGKSFNYSLDDYRAVDPALISYREVEAIIPSVQNITAVATDESGRIYVAGEHAVEMIGADRIPVEGQPDCIAVDAAHTLFLGMRDHILVVPENGERKSWTPPGEKTFLTSIAVDDWYVYAADAGSRRIWRFKKEGGEPLEIGQKNWAKGIRGFFIPSPYFDIAVSRADGSLWAVNPGHHALENYRPDGMPLSTWEASGMHIEGFSGCCNPAHFALLPDGGFVTAEKGLPRVKVHNVDGSFRCVVAGPDQFDEEVAGLDVAVGEDGKIYVLDPGRQRVRVFEEVP